MSADPVFWLLLFLTVSCAVFFFWTAYHRGERFRRVLWGGSTLTCVCLLLAHSIRADFHSFALAGIVVMLVSVVVSMYLKARHGKYLTTGK